MIIQSRFSCRRFILSKWKMHVFGTSPCTQDRLNSCTRSILTLCVLTYSEDVSLRQAAVNSSWTKLRVLLRLAGSPQYVRSTCCTPDKSTLYFTFFCLLMILSFTSSFLQLTAFKHKTYSISATFIPDSD